MKRAKKFAIPLNISVSRETFERAHKLQQEFDKMCWNKFSKRFRMSDLGEIIWDIGLKVLEELEKNTIYDTLRTEHIDNSIIAVEVKKAKKALKHAKSLSDLTDDQVEYMLKSKESD